MCVIHCKNAMFMSMHEIKHLEAALDTLRWSPLNVFERTTLRSLGRVAFVLWLMANETMS